MITRFSDRYRNIPDPPAQRDWNAAQCADLRICNAAKLTLELAASMLMKLPRCQNPSLPDLRDIVTDMRELIGRLERAEELINDTIRDEDQ